MDEIKTYSFQRLQALFKEWNIPQYRAQQVYTWIYQKGVHSYDEMTNLPHSLREQLAADLPFLPAQIMNKQVSQDGTRKYLIEFHDGSLTEMVAIPSHDRLTVCFSTQVGCAMSCSFCATGKEGFTRNLLPGEMVEQVLLVQDDMKRRVSNLVAMGQGEPFLNYNNLIDALHIFNDKKGLHIAARHITVSTCGIIDGIKRFSQENEQFTLAVSLHSALQDTRDDIMPAVKHQPLDVLQKALIKYQKETNRRVTFEYLLIAGVNDSHKHLMALIDYCSGLKCHVNLIRLNAVEESPLKPSSQRKTEEFVNTLTQAGIEATLRRSRGSDIDGACGQLKNKLGV